MFRITEVNEMEYLLSSNKLTKSFRKHNAVDAVSINIKQGEIYGLIGRNGAGKTTLMKMLCGLSSPTSGDFSLFGKKGSERAAVMSRVGSLIESPGLYYNLSAKDNLHLKATAFGVREGKDYEQKLLDIVGLSDVGKKPAGKFSLGMKQRLGIAMALIGDPDLLILDEPINGLDPQGIVEVREILQKLNRERKITILISSHILEELSKLATCYGIIHNGKMLEELSHEELVAKCKERIELKVSDPAKACTVLDGMGFTQYKAVGGGQINILERCKESSEITLAMAKAGIAVTGISVCSEALEDYYLNLTGGMPNV